MSALAVDVDDPATWPEAIWRYADNWANQLRDTTAFAGDLGTPSDEEPFRELFKGFRLRAFHATRLLPHEVGAVRDSGLQWLTKDLVRQRVDEAYRNGHLDDQSRVIVLNSNVFAERSHANRENRVCCFLGQTPLHQSAPVWHLLSTWGGEGIYKSAAGSDLPANLKTLGTPAIVEVHLGYERIRQTTSFPNLDKPFVGRLLDLADVTADLTIRSPVPPKDIVAIHRPGDSVYDFFRELPSN